MTILLAELTFRGTFPRWLAVVFALAVLAGVPLFYARERAGRLRPLLGGLRVAALLLLVLLLLKPAWVVERTAERPRPVALLADNSQSMTQRDPRLNAADRLRAALAFDQLPPDKPLPVNASLADQPADAPNRPSRAEVLQAVFANRRLQLAAALEKRGPVKAYLFGTRLRSVPPAEAAAPKADEPKTALADACLELLGAEENERPTALVVATDGRDNASGTSLEELARECVRQKVPLHVYGVGCSGVGTVQVKDVALNDTLFADDTVTVPVRWRCQGFRQGTVELVVSLGGREVARKTVPAREGEDFLQTLAFTPTKADAQQGRLDLVTTVRLTNGGESFADESRKPVRVVDRKVKVLLIDSAPRWEYKFLQRALLRDRRVQASCLLTEGDPQTMASGPPYLPAFPSTRRELFAFDLVVLGDVPASALGPDHVGWLRDFVAEGGGLVLIAGRRHAPADYVNTPLADVLPVEAQAVRFPDESRTEPFKAKLTPEGERSEVTALADNPDENARLWRTLPGLHWHYPVTKLRPGAVALLAHPRLEADRKPMPLLATHYYGKGLAVFWAAEESWRWRFNEEDRLFGRFWGQVVYQAGLPHSAGTKLAQLAVDRTESVLGRTGQVYARLFNAEYKPLAAERVTARLERLDAGPGERSSPVVLEAVPGQPGEFTAALPHDRVGRFAVRLDAPEPASAEFRVSLPPGHELAPGGMAEEALRKLASASGGAFYREEDLHKLAPAVAPRAGTFVERRELVLWDGWVLALFVGLLTAEWVGRKFSNLS